MSRVYGVDLGTSTLKIYQKNKGIIYDERNVMAVFDKRKIIAIGDEAWVMDGRTPPNIEVIHPVRQGVLAELKNMVEMLNMIFGRLEEDHGKMTGQDFLIAVPSYATEVEKMALVDLIDATNVRARRIMVVPRPVADALGTGVNIRECMGTMIVDVGAATTEISILSLGGIVESKMLKLGGDRIDESIINAVRKEYNFVIGKKTAEQVKNDLANALPPTEDDLLVKRFFGRNVVSGLPGSIPIDSAFIHTVIKDHIEHIAETVRNTFENCAPEVSMDIMENGMYLTGGVAGIRNFDKVLEKITNLKVHRCIEGSESAVTGLGRIMETPDLAFLAEEYDDPDIT